jgi:galactonate dehydratase
LKHAASIFRYIREAVGDELEVAIGTHGQFSTAGAIRAAKVFEEYEPMWFEEPVPPEMVEEMARVASQTSIPIASGERLATKYEFASLIEKQAAGIIQVDVGQCGGILEAKKIAAIAEAHHALIAPHMFVGPIAAAAAIQLDSCSTNFMMQEFNVGPLHGELFDEPITVVDGYITPPSGPGLGLVLNDEVVGRHLSR